MKRSYTDEFVLEEAKYINKKLGNIQRDVRAFQYAIEHSRLAHESSFEEAQSRAAF